MSRGTEKFRIFISHKHDDHDNAAGLAQVLEGLDEQIKCFVSGTNLVAGSDWNAEIRSQLLETDMLLLLFTEPSKNWDWCLYEAGLFTSLGDEHSVVCLYQAGGDSPRPLKALQGVPVEQEPVQRFLGQLCTETWRVARKWRFGALRPTVTTDRLSEVTQRVLALFPKPRTASAPVAHLTHYPCHRVVLDLRGQPDAFNAIPDGARVLEGEGATSTFTMSLFNLTRGLRSRTWKDLVTATGNPGGQWLADLNTRYAAAMQEQLFSPALITPMPLIDAYTGQRRRSYRPVLYEIQRAPSGDAATTGPESLMPLQLTLVLDPVADNPMPTSLA